MTTLAEVELELSAALSATSSMLEREQTFRRRQASALSQVWSAGDIPISNGSGLSNSRGKNQARTGFCWSVRRLTVAGFTAGTVTAYRNDPSGEPMAPFPQAAVFTFGRGEMMLMPDDALVWSATGVTAANGASVFYWVTADCFEQWYLPYYIG